MRAVIFAILFVLLAIYWGGIFVGKYDCEQRGGVYVQGLFKMVCVKGN